LARNNSELGQSRIAEAEVMVRHTSGKHLLVNAFLNDIPVKVVVDTAAMITLVNEKLIC
jgi:predicted aspartyl protease